MVAAMNAVKSLGHRKAGESIQPAPEPKLRLLRPPSECSTTELVSELSRQVKVMLRRVKTGRQRRRTEAAKKGGE